MKQCRACRAAYRSQPSGKVITSLLSKAFNDIVAIDHFHLDNICIFHAVDYVTRLSALHVVESTMLEKAVTDVEARWSAQYWYP